MRTGTLQRGARTLCFQEAGDPAGAPVFVLHGTPGCRYSGVHPDEQRLSAAGLRIVSYDRPGYGRSTRLRGRTVLDCVQDVEAIADELGIERFALSGGSGGGPHALAVGARLADRVARVLCEVSPAPFDAEGLEWMRGMDPVNVAEFGWALEGERKLLAQLEVKVAEVLSRIDEDPAALAQEADLSAADRAVLEDPTFRASSARNTREALAQGALGWVDDELALIGPWGFSPQELRVAVEVRYGPHDVLVPPAHGEWLARHIPTARAAVDDERGHLLTADQRLALLADFVRPEPSPAVRVLVGDRDFLDDAARLWAAATAARDGDRDLAPLSRSRPLIEQVLAADGSMILLLDADTGELQAFATAQPTRDEEANALVGYFAVHPRAWGRGLGRRLAAELPGRLRELGFERAWLLVYPDNAPAVALYERNGWRPTGETHVNPRSGRVMMRYELAL